MKQYAAMSREELLEERSDLQKAYKGFEEAGLSLNMARGKPAPSQLDLSMDMLKILTDVEDMKSESGDVRNYGAMDGIAEAKQLMAGMLECDPANVIVLGNASLNIMYDMVARSYAFGVMGSTPWCKLDKVKFLCPVPGYDRHFAVTADFGIEMINIPMTPDGPDMDKVEEMVNSDPAVKGIWCVPKYSNPQGVVYSDETVKRFAALKPAAEDFRIYWDNAYCVHHLYDDESKQGKLLNILEECAKAGNPDMVYEFGSTSKVTFAGAGISAVASSENNLKEIKKHLTIQTIGHDKINQIRHVRFLKDRAGIDAHMKKHAALLAPKFEMVEKLLNDEIVSRGIGSFLHVNGGYFICFESLPGCAKDIVAKCKAAGVVLTGAGAPFPYGKDPKDSVIRIAPSYPEIDDLKKAMEVFVVCVRLASVEKLLGE